MAFELGQRVRYHFHTRHQDGTITNISDVITVTLDRATGILDGLEREFTFDGAGLGAAGEGYIQPLEEPRTMFELNSRVITESGLMGTVHSIDGYINVRFDNGDEHHYLLPDGDPCCGGPRIQPLADQTSIFKVGQRVTYHMNSGETADGAITAIDDTFVHVLLDATQSYIRAPETPRVFYLDGRGVGRFTAIPEGTRTSDREGRIVKALPKWEPTKGREYPPEPRLVYGAFDTYYGRPVQPGNPTGEGVQIGWGVLCDDPRFSQVIRDTEDRAKADGYLANALVQWQDKCYDIDIAAIENPFDVLLGCEIYRAWLHSDNLGFELYFPRELVGYRARSHVQFNYPAACCTSGLIAMDDLNAFFSNNASAMRVNDVEGTKITINETSFHVIPKFIENFKPTIAPADTQTKLRLLQNLAMQLAKRDSTHGEALALAA